MYTLKNIFFDIRTGKTKEQFISFKKGDGKYKNISIKNKMDTSCIGSINDITNILENYSGIEHFKITSLGSYK